RRIRQVSMPPRRMRLMKETANDATMKTPPMAAAHGTDVARRSERSTSSPPIVMRIAPIASGTATPRFPIGRCHSMIAFAARCCTSDSGLIERPDRGPAQREQDHEHECADDVHPAKRALAGDD